MNPFYGEILKAIESELDRSRQTFILSNHYDSVEKQRTFIETLLQLGGDGVIMCDSDMNDYELAPNALEGSIFRMLRQGQRVVFQLNDKKQAAQISLGSEADMKTPGY